ncbi:DUF2283 domain-containing protein [Patescibacteria group bacterium]|nr:DUF2283 domain-containing protein [Candidatus Falkowbacteria bacterium]MBU3906308.1 DUF2283 domain-containing protein [Patescibacteria group bacterium]MBU4015354.1 DUF2283 domain-containing protein [Patescibacteria group bacterium]MBU4026913.1 DUF2283 domain-containing protein [Patescibacteria group bacterium]MBU4072936.1 DUF2283 domain-containing protein [Patescibacteria group bacterium]
MAKTREQKLKAIKIYYDSLGNTLNVWFGDPKKEFISEETGDEVILNKDKKGKVIGFEKLNFFKQGNTFIKSLPVEVFLQ